MEKLGEIKVSNEAIGTIAALAATSVDGVVGMSEGIREGIARLVSGIQGAKGVRVETGKEEAVINVSIIVRYGVRILDVCFNVQSAVRKAVSEMTGLSIIEVNVFVEGVGQEGEKRILR
ncbi:TPA: Asp23/Gls24 family envelope stress response protein [bacterium]|nr:Asp23/Gls24 family envelope stress response protein [bacterium]